MMIISAGQRHHATVSTLHSFTKSPEEITRHADVVISDVGTPNLVQPDWLKPGAVVVDMGTNPVKVRSVSLCTFLDIQGYFQS